MQKALIGRQPIFDNSGEIFAYELLFRSSEANFANVTDNSAATSNVLLTALSTIGLDKLIGDKQAFINVDKKLLISGVLDQLPQSRFVIEILEDVIVDREITEKISSMRSDGFTFAIDDLDNSADLMANFEPIMEHTSILKLDLMAAGGVDGIKNNMHLFDRSKHKLLIEKVENKDEYEECKKLGFDYFQGYFFEKPTIIEGKKLESSKIEVLSLFRKLLNETDLDEIAIEIAKSAELSINLLKYVNSASIATKIEITSIPQAVSLLGRLPISQWLMLHLYGGSDNKFSNPIMESLLKRAEIMRAFTLEIKQDKQLSEEAYLAGMLSFFDAIMQIPLEDIKDEISLKESLYEAITEKTNFIGNMLKISQLLEKCDASKIETVSKATKISPEKITKILNDCFVSAT